MCTICMRNIWVATLKVKVLKLFHRNDHHIETTLCEQDLGRYIAGQGHSMTLQQNHVRPITWLFEVWFYNYFTEMITILRRCVANNIWVFTLKVKVTAWPCSKIMSGQYLCYLKSYFKTVSQKWSLYCVAVSRGSRIFQLLDRSIHHIKMMCHYLAHCLALCVLYCIIPTLPSSVT